MKAPVPWALLVREGGGGWSVDGRLPLDLIASSKRASRRRALDERRNNSSSGLLLPSSPPPPHSSTQSHAVFLLESSSDTSCATSRTHNTLPASLLVPHRTPHATRTHFIPSRLCLVCVCVSHSAHPAAIVNYSLLLAVVVVAQGPRGFLAPWFHSPPAVPSHTTFVCWRAVAVGKLSTAARPRACRTCLLNNPICCSCQSIAPRSLVSIYFFARPSHRPNSSSSVSCHSLSLSTAPPLSLSPSLASLVSSKH